MSEVSKRKDSPENDSDQPKRVKLTNQHEWTAVELRETGETVRDSECVKFFNSEDLQTMCIPQSLSDIYGLEKIKALLKTTILQPLDSPQVYEINTSSFNNPDKEMGKIPPVLVSCLYGVRHSGTKTAVRTFCVESHIPLIEVSYVGFKVSAIDLAYNHAQKNIPAVVMFNECEGYFGPDPRMSDPAAVAKLNSWLGRLKTSNVPVWTIFITTLDPIGYNVFHQAISSSIKHFQWSDKLKPADRERAFTYRINSFLWPGQETPVKGNLMKTLKQVSAECTVGDIYAYVERVFRRGIDRQGLPTETIHRDDPRLVPTVEDFAACLEPAPNQQKRITTIDPHTTNVQPYSNEVIGSADHGWGT